MKLIKTCSPLKNKTSFHYFFSFFLMICLKKFEPHNPGSGFFFSPKKMDPYSSTSKNRILSSNIEIENWLSTGQLTVSLKNHAIFFSSQKADPSGSGFEL